MNKDKSKKYKELYNKYKELKKDPRKKAGMKLLGYLIFFLIIILLTSISSSISSDKKIINKTTTTTTTKIIDTYLEKQNKLLKDKYNVTYNITYNNKEYKINGILENNIFNGYLEDNNDIKKISIKDNEIYEISNNNENLINFDFNNNYLNIKNIFDLIKQNSVFKQEKDNIKTYLYEINDENNSKIYIKTNENNILEIKVEESENTYLLTFDK